MMCGSRSPKTSGDEQVPKRIRGLGHGEEREMLSRTLNMAAGAVSGMVVDRLRFFTPIFYDRAWYGTEVAIGLFKRTR